MLVSASGSKSLEIIATEERSIEEGSGESTSSVGEESEETNESKD